MTFEELRAKLESHFQADTSNDPFNYVGGSHGHCAAVSYIVNRIFGGQYCSTKIGQYCSTKIQHGKRPEVSHWFNRVSIGGIEIDVDLTADQFGRNKVSYAFKDHLWYMSSSMLMQQMYCNDTHVRQAHELNKETIDRANLLMKRANLPIPTWNFVGRGIYD